MPLLGVVVQMAALGLLSWAMDSARRKGRELPGGTTPPVTPAPPVPPVEPA
jgi:hypothetical protein